MKKIAGFLALAGFIAALIVHIATLNGVDVSGHFPAVWGLHVGIFVVFVPFVLSSRKSLGPKPTFAEIRAAFPMWGVVAGCCILAYAMANFLFSMVAIEGGNPSIVDNKYVLLNHGKLVRELTAIEYSAFKANQVRAFSGHWLVFYFVPCAYFLFHKSANKSSLQPADSAGLTH